MPYTIASLGNDLKIYVTGLSSTEIKWVCTLKITKIEW
jgi:hypothetical protein